MKGRKRGRAERRRHLCEVDTALCSIHCHYEAISAYLTVTRGHPFDQGMVEFLARWGAHSTLLCSQIGGFWAEI